MLVFNGPNHSFFIYNVDSLVNFLSFLPALPEMFSTILEGLPHTDTKDGIK
jgi:hypothetical protein